EGCDAARDASRPYLMRQAREAKWGDATQWVEHAALPAPRDTARPRVLLAGSMPPDERLHAAVEHAGATVVAEAHALALRRLGPEIVADDENLPRVVARALREASTAPRAFVDRGAAVLARAREARADAVVVWLTREDEALAWGVPGMRRTLDAAEKPALVIPAARWQADDGALERINEFCSRCTRASA